MVIKSEQDNIWIFTIKRFRFTILLIISIVILGVFAIFSLPREASPEVKIPLGIVSAIYPSAAPVDVESLVTQKLEKELIELDGVADITSSSANGLSLIIVQFDPKEDLVESIRNLKDKVQNSANLLPPDVENLQVKEVSFSDLPVLTFSLSGDFSIQELNNYAEILKDEVESVSEVSEVQIIGNQLSEWQVILDPNKVNGLNLSIFQIMDVIRNSNINLPIGSVEISENNYNSRLENSLKTIQDLNNLPILNSGENLIIIKDIADVKEDLKTKTTISKLSVNDNGLKSSISIQIYKKTGGNVIKMVDKINEIVEEKKINEFPSDLEINTVTDNASEIRKQTNTLLTSGLQTIVIVFIIIFLFLGFRESIVVAISVPLTFLISFTLLYFTGYTLNELTLFSLILSLGMLVDSSIVIADYIYENIHTKKMSKMDAAINAIYMCRWPIAAGTLTTVAAFLPMLLVSGIMGEFIKSIPVTISYTLLASLFISIFINPALLQRISKPYKENEKKSNINNEISKKSLYTNFLRRLSLNRWSRRFIIFIFAGLFLLSMALPISGILPVQMFPNVDLDYFYINVETKQGNILTETEKVTDNISDILFGYDEIKNFSVNIGSETGTMSTSVFSGGSSSNSSHLANFVVNLKEDREIESFKIVEELNMKFANYPGALIKIFQESAGPPTAAPVEVKIYGLDFNVLSDLAATIENELKNIEGTRNIENSMQSGLPEFVFTVDRNKASYYGIMPSQVSTYLMAAVSGLQVSSITHEGDEKDIVLKYYVSSSDKQNRLNLSELKNISIPTQKGNIPLSQFVNTNFSSSFSEIDHQDQKRVISVTSLLDEGIITQDVFNELNEKLKEKEIPNGYEIKMGGELEEINESFADLFNSLIIGVILIFIILILEFDSFKQSFIVLFTLPLALIGVFWGLFLLGYALSFPAFIGVVALAGVVVNNAIILIDQINFNIREKGINLYDSVASSVGARIKPIFLTTITTVIGIFPLVLSDPIWAPLGLSLIFGLTFSTILTLLVIPLLYVSFEEKRINREL